MVSFNKLTRTLAGIAAAALIVPLAACGGSGNGGTATAEGIPAKGTDDGTEITLWTRSPLERQAKNVVEAYNKSHKNQVKLEIIPNDDMEGKVGGASQTDSLPDILAGDVVRIPYWASEGIFTDITKQIDGLDNKADLQQGHIEAGTVDGAEYTLPFITDVSVMVWNKNLYKEAGLDPEQGPKSIDQFVEQAKKVAALNKDGVAGSYTVFKSSNSSNGVRFYTNSNGQLQNSKVVLNGKVYQIVDSFGEMNFVPDGGTAIITGDEYRDVKAVLDNILTQMGFEYSGRAYITDKLITKNLGTIVEGSASLTYPTGYVQELVTDDPSAKPPQTGDNASVVGFVMIAIALVAAAAVTVKKVRA